MVHVTGENTLIYYEAKYVRPHGTRETRRRRRRRRPHFATSATYGFNDHKTDNACLLKPLLGGRNSKQLYFEFQSRVGWDDGWETSCAICVVWCAGQHCLLSDGELWNTLIPALDDLSNANSS